MEVPRKMDFSTIGTNREEEITQIVEDLIVTVEKEVQTFQKLHVTLLEQQRSLLSGGAEAVVEKNAEVDTLVSVTKNLRNDWKTQSRSLSAALKSEGDLRLEQIIPLVEVKYANRLTELREMLLSLREKVKTTNQRNRVLLERSIRYVDRCMYMLTGNTGQLQGYGPGGKCAKDRSHIFQGQG